MMADSARGTNTPRSYYSSHEGNNKNSHNNNISALFRDENHHPAVETSSMSLGGLDHNNNLTPQNSSRRQFKENGDDGSTSLVSFQKIKDERDYDRRSYSRKRSESYDKTQQFVRTSSPDRGGGGGGGSNYYPGDHAHDDIKYSKEYGNDNSRQQSGSRESESTISYIDYNDSAFIDRKRRGNNKSGENHRSGRSREPSAADDRRLGSTVRTIDIRAGSTATASTITFDDYNRFNQSQSLPRQQQQGQHPQQPFIGHDGKSVNYAKYRSEDNYSTMSKPQVPIDITVPSPTKFVQKTSINMHNNHRNYNGRELKKPPYSSSRVHVHEMGSRRHVSKRRPSSSKSRASSSRGSDNRKANRRSSSSRNSRSSSTTSKRSRSSDGKRSSNSSRSRSSDGGKRNNSSSNRSTRSRSSDERRSSSRRSEDSSKSGSSNGRSNKSRSRNRSDHDSHRSSRRRDLKRDRHVEFNDHLDQRSVKSSSSSDKERRRRDRRRDMMTGRATKHLLDDEKSTNSRSSKSTYSRSSVRHDVDDDGYCMHHPEIELMRLKSDGFWSTVRKKCPECIYEDCPSLLGDIGVDEKDDETYADDDNHRSAATNDESAAARAILNSTRLFSFHNIMSPEDIEKEEELRRLKRRLAARAYHFPGNTWWQDWMQYLSNTHTVLGLFFHQ